MNTAKLIASIFQNNELTMQERAGRHISGRLGVIPTAILNKWHPDKKTINLDYDTCHYMFLYGILTTDSANSETGETHLYLNIKVLKELHDTNHEILKGVNPVKLLPAHRELQLNRIDEQE